MSSTLENEVAKSAKTPEPSIVMVSIENVDISDEVQPRTRLDPRTVEAYASSYEAGERLPFPVVFYDSSPQWGGTKMWLADGFHRVRALRNIGRKKIQVDKRVGTKRDAVLFALEANIRHGLRMSNEDKRRCAEILLKDPDWSKWSDREISKKIGVSNTFVSNLRKELAGVNGSQVPEQRKGSDGKVYHIPKRTENAASPTAPSGKWKCDECSTFWPDDVKVCRHCKPEPAAEKEPSINSADAEDCKAPETWECDKHPGHELSIDDDCADCEADEALEIALSNFEELDEYARACTRRMDLLNLQNQARALLKIVEERLEAVQP